VTTPAWLDALVAALPTLRPEQVSRWGSPPPGASRRSGVLALFGEGVHGPDLLLTERADTLRSHAGQPAFPGGRVDDTDDGPVGAALREAAEEVGLDPAAVDVIGSFPEIWLAASRYVVTPVVAWWREPHAVGPVDAAEVAAVRRVPISQLVDPGRRVTVTHPSGYEGPGFDLDGLLVWGFTAGVIDQLLRLGGWAQPWDRSRRRELDAATVALARRTAEAVTGLGDE
jgi:8-oxo-dGTP pyrophosphatase MutT (NUDIX family)